MAHQLTIRANGFAEMAYRGATPWTGLGNIIREDATMEENLKSAGMDWTIERSPVMYKNGAMHTDPNNEVLYRSDNNNPLGIVSARYKVVQPFEVMEFFKSLIADDGFVLETAGTLYEGRRFWALANTGLGGEVVGNDLVNAYLLLATSCDGSLATTAKFTSTRVVCNNTLQMALRQSAADGKTVKVRHNTEFDPVKVQGMLGLNANAVYEDFMGRMKVLADTPVSESKAKEVLERVFIKAMSAGVPVSESHGFKTVMSLFQGAGKGSRLPGVKGTAWGLVNAVTEYTDFHSRARSSNNRLNNAWFGSGSDLKERVVQTVEML